MQFWRYLGDPLCSATGGIMNVGNYHGGGSPIREQIAITTQCDIESRKKLVKYIAGMSGGDREVLAPETGQETVCLRFGSSVASFFCSIK